MWKLPSSKKALLVALIGILVVSLYLYATRERDCISPETNKDAVVSSDAPATKIVDQTQKKNENENENENEIRQRGSELDNANRNANRKGLYNYEGSNKD